MNLQLRNYQKELIDKIYACWQQGDRKVMAQCPTGGGKTICLTAIAQEKQLRKYFIFSGCLSNSYDWVSLETPIFSLIDN